MITTLTKERTPVNTKSILAACLLLFVCAGQPTVAQREAPPPPRPIPTRPHPDLIVKEYQFPPTYDKGLRVNVANIGNAAAGASVLRLTVRKIKGIAVGRTMEIAVPAIPASQDDWVTLDAKGILPKDVSLKDTTFKLNADATTLVGEANEANNEKWHNLN